MLDPIQKLRRHLETTADDLRRSTFASPPTTYEAFMKLVGRHEQIQTTIRDLAELNKDEDDEK